MKDVSRARKFYEEKVGLTPKEEVAGGVVYECGKGSWVFMYPSDGAGTSLGQHGFLGGGRCRRRSCCAEISRRQVRGIRHARGLRTVNGIATGGGAKTAWFKDTEGQHSGRESKFVGGECNSGACEFACYRAPSAAD